MRTAKAYGRVYMSEDTVNMIKSGGIKKGDVLSVAQVGGIMAAKRTSEIIPMCHPVMTTGIDINFDINKDNIEIYSTVKCKGETGVEMEALNCGIGSGPYHIRYVQGLQKDMVIGEIKLLEKSGGKSR